MDQMQFFAQQPKNRVTPKQDEYNIEEDFIVRMFLLHMHQFVLKDALPRSRFQGNILVPENILKK